MPRGESHRNVIAHSYHKFIGFVAHGRTNTFIFDGFIFGAVPSVVEGWEAAGVPIYPVLLVISNLLWIRFLFQAGLEHHNCGCPVLRQNPLGRGQQSSGRPLQRHVLSFSAGHMPVFSHNPAWGRIQQVGRAQTAAQCGRQAQAVEREHFPKVFPQALRRRLSFAFQPPGQWFESDLAGLGVQLNVRPHRRPGLIVLFFGQMGQDVAYLVLAATLHRSIRAKHRINPGPQHVLCALGVDPQGYKHVLGLAPGVSENPTVV